MTDRLKSDPSFATSANTIPYISNVTHGSIHIVQSGPNADKYYANYSPPFLNSNIGATLLALFKKIVIVISCGQRDPLSSKSRPSVLKQSQPEKLLRPSALSP